MAALVVIAAQEPSRRLGPRTAAAVKTLLSAPQGDVAQVRPHRNLLLEYTCMAHTMSPSQSAGEQIWPSTKVRYCLAVGRGGAVDVGENNGRHMRLLPHGSRRRSVRRSLADRRRLFEGVVASATGAADGRAQCVSQSEHD